MAEEAFDIGRFRSQMVGDGARPNLFRVVMTYPAFLSVGGGNQATSTFTTAQFGESTNSADAIERFSFMCRTAQLPGDNIGTVPVFYMGREIKLPGNRTFPEWTVTLMNDENFVVRNTLEKWMNGINSHVGNLRDRAALRPMDYSVDAYVYQFGKTGDTLKVYKFIGMFPMDISPVELDWGQNDAIEEFSVSFAYQWWETQESTT